MNLKRTSTALLAMALVAFSAPVAAANSEDYVLIDGIEVDATLDVNTSVELEELLLGSPVPVSVEINPATGEIEKIEETEQAPALVTPLISQSKTCKATDVCLYAPRVPYANNGFSGKGTVTGTWSPKKTYYTGSWTSQIKWRYNGSTVTGPKLGPKLTGTLLEEVAVTSVRIF